MLNPLSAGPHTLHFDGTGSAYDAGAFQVPQFSVDVTVNLNVVAANGGGGAAAPLPASVFAGALCAVPAMILRRKIMRSKK